MVLSYWTKLQFFRYSLLSVNARSLRFFRGLIKTLHYTRRGKDIINSIRVSSLCINNMNLTAVQSSETFLKKAFKPARFGSVWSFTEQPNLLVSLT